MCNLYNMTDKGEAERYLGSVRADMCVDVEDYTATTVGPYQTGLFVRPAQGSQTRKLVGRLGQWGMIRQRKTCVAGHPDQQRTHRRHPEARHLPGCLAQRTALFDLGRVVPGAELGNRQEHLVADAPGQGPALGAGRTVVRMDGPAHR